MNDSGVLTFTPAPVPTELSAGWVEFTIAAMAISLAVLVLLRAALQFWLAHRHTRHVLRHRAEVPGAFAAHVSLAAHHKAADYTAAKMGLAGLEIGLEGMVLLGWTLLGGLDALNQALLAVMEPGLAQQLALVVGFTLVGALIDLPFSWWRTFRLEQRFGFNRMTLRMWLADLARGSVVAALIGLPLVAAVLWLMHSAGVWWWAWAWGLWMGFNLLLMVIYPTLIAPLFNRFTPLADMSLRERVEALMQRCGFAASGLFVMDGSRRSAHANAYFTGLGRAKRVVFFDTLLAKLTAGEVEAVLAHELGHFKHGHIRRRLWTMGVVSLGALALLGWLAQQPWFYFGLGVTPSLMADGNHALALLLFMLVLPVVAFFVTPVLASRSRADEFQADAFAAAHADGADLARALLKLHEDNASTLTPDPLFVRFYFSHPPAVERLARLPELPPPTPAPGLT
jgi:STE24 endopeptidase